MSAAVEPQKMASFFVKDCAFATMATGLVAQTLVEFKHHLKNISPESIYFHFWRPTIETTLPPGSFYNDFSHWAHYDLHDDFLAERLALLDPTEYNDLEKLRVDMLEIVDTRIDESGSLAFSVVKPFYFIKAKIVVFNTAYRLETPKDLVRIIPELAKSSIFYHFIDARTRLPSAQDDFSVWLQRDDNLYLPLIQELKQIDPYFISLVDLQQKLSTAVTKYFLQEPNNA